MRKRKRFLTAVLALVMVFVPAASYPASGLSQAQKEKAALEAELAEAQKLIDGLKDSKDDIKEKVRQLDERLTAISSRIIELEQELSQTGEQIEDTKLQLADAQEDANRQYERMKQRIKYMYENGSSMTMLEALLTSGSIADFINQAEYINQITKYDRNMLTKYQQTKQLVADSKQTLESDYEQLETLKAQVQAEQNTVQKLLAAKEEELSGVEGDLSTAQADADIVAAEIQAQEDIIAQIKAQEAKKEAERKAAEEAAKKQNETSAGEAAPKPPTEKPYSGGVFVWPCPSSTRVTSDYGTRLSPTAGASSNHKGIDIGAAYGSAIVAAADATVAFAGYNSGMGNYVMLSHGSGLYTVYGHCSALLVSTGDTVSAGQTIAQVGSTGISTGNHLHFGVSKDGVYVSPWNYLSR